MLRILVLAAVLLALASCAAAPPNSEMQGDPARSVLKDHGGGAGGGAGGHGGM